jgi:hypothetical protein
VDGALIESFPYSVDGVQGQQFNLQAIPASGYDFVGWSGAIDSSNPAQVITLDSEMVISATFDFTTQNGLPQFITAMGNAGLSGTNAEFDATPFNDGVPNLLKYAFNMNLSGSDSQSMIIDGSSGIPSGRLIEVDGLVHWQVQYVVRKGAGLAYAAVKSTTLKPGSFEAMTATPIVEQIDSEWERITVNEPIDPLSSPVFFSRVAVTLLTLE